MRVLSLLFDPRGAIDRRAFWSGLLQLTAVSVALYVGLIRFGPDVAPAALPVIGEAFAVGGVASHAYGAVALNVPLAASILIVAARFYATACLLLKRSRDAGWGVGPPAAFGLAGLLIHGAMGLWAYALFGDGMAVIVPIFADMTAAALFGAIFLASTGARPSASERPRGGVDETTPRRRRPEVKPAS